MSTTGVEDRYVVTKLAGTRATANSTKIGQTLSRCCSSISLPCCSSDNRGYAMSRIWAEAASPLSSTDYNKCTHHWSQDDKSCRFFTQVTQCTNSHSHLSRIKLFPFHAMIHFERVFSRADSWGFLSFCWLDSHWLWSRAKAMEHLCKPMQEQ